jgi:predicted nucleic acid-binding protein
LIYLDASVLVPLCRVEPRTARINRLLMATEADLLVSDFAIGEVGATMARLVRTQEIGSDDAADRLAKFDVWHLAATRLVSTEARDVQNASLLVRQFTLQLRLPDAIHTSIARRTGSQLVTADRKLFDACQQIDCDALLIA